MSYLLAILISGSILLGFVLILAIERGRGVRFFPITRKRLDARVARLFYIVEHVDWGAFFSHVLKLTIDKIAHDIVHGTLIVIRGIEKYLTKAIRLLRSRLAGHEGTETDGFQLKETIKRFRKSLHKDL